MSVTEKFIALFYGLEECGEDEQMQKIEEIKRMIIKMNEEEFVTVFTEEMFNKMGKMIEEKTLSWGNTILLLKNAGSCKEMKSFFCDSFDDSLLSERMKVMIIDKNEKKKEEKNERLMVDLCKCFSLLNVYFISSELHSITAPHLLKAASKKEESEEIQKEVEMALLALSNIRGLNRIDEELCLNVIKEIIQYHQEHHNLTRLAYHSAWMFLISRLDDDKDMEDDIINKLHFMREAKRELEALSKSVNLMREEMKKVLVLKRWLETLESFFFICWPRNEEYVELIECLVQLFRAAKDNYRKLGDQCILVIGRAAENRAVEIEDLLESDTIDVFLEVIHKTTLDDKMMHECLRFFTNVSNKLKGKADKKNEEAKRKASKRKIFEKMEEEGYEDIIASFFEVFSFHNRYFGEFSNNITDYFVYV
ncbi:uncharacterized protein MONOS_16870 [Monocercomonoides exilis]|uniref:uncharacterized protein n=1 Tax=Monocercomonoides exilis TaxID=2049356 RepID=UPI0035596BA0|nr:hypothetical protein MONOS_16870 [Monocercomonoides exilis]